MVSNLFDGMKFPIQDRALKHRVVELEYDFDLSPEDLERIVASFVDRFSRHLDTWDKADMPMLPSYVTRLPTGKETGTFLALDLGGTNLRVCQVELKGDGTFDLKQKKQKIDESIKTGSSDELFGYIADAVGDFIKSNGTDGNYDSFPLGFTFSFPTIQTAIDEGRILGWSKGFNVPDALDADVGELMQKALDARNINVKCVAIVNDTVGTLMASAYQTHGKARMGVIFGTGTNGAYVEQGIKIRKIADHYKETNKEVPQYMVVNTEWGSFDDSRHDVMRYSFFDKVVDASSINPGRHAFEKEISGMYLGEIFRVVLLDLVNDEKIRLFGGFKSKALASHYGVDTAAMSAVEALRGKDVSKEELVAHVKEASAKYLGVDAKKMTDDEALVVHRISELIGTRAALLSSCAISGVIEKTTLHDEEVIGVAADGSLVEHYPEFEDRLRRGLVSVLGQDIEKKCTFLPAKDGSGMGAAVCAWSAVASD